MNERFIRHCGVFMYDCMKNAFKSQTKRENNENNFHMQLINRSISEQYLICVKFTVAVAVTPVLFPDLYGCFWLEALTGYQSPGLRG